MLTTVPPASTGTSTDATDVFERLLHVDTKVPSLTASHAARWFGLVGESDD